MTNPGVQVSNIVKAVGTRYEPIDQKQNIKCTLEFPDLRWVIKSRTSPDNPSFRSHQGRTAETLDKVDVQDFGRDEGTDRQRWYP